MSGLRGEHRNRGERPDAHRHLARIYEGAAADKPLGSAIFISSSLLRPV
jgi:hypothetical protein